MSSSSTSSDPLLQVDDFYFSVLLFSDDNEDEEIIFPISDEKYAESLSLQEALMSAVLLFSDGNEDEEIIFPISDEKYAESLSLQEALMSAEVIAAASSSTQMSASVTYTNNNKLKLKEIGESFQRFCGICMEGKQSEEMFMNEACSHAFCSECISGHIAAKLQEGITVTCPEPICKEIIEPYTCQAIVPVHVFERWGNALCESAIQGYQKFYCPYKDCSVMFVDDGGEVIRQTECLHCRRLFCAQCLVPWHSDMQCEEFQRLGLDERSGTDLMLMSLAKEKNWRRCPNCKIYVEKKDGCLHMTCRCKFEFCYNCGATWSSSHGGCAAR